MMLSKKYAFASLRKSSDFRRVMAEGRKQVKPGFVLLAIPHQPDRPAEPHNIAAAAHGADSPAAICRHGQAPAVRVGFTCSKKIGKAVTRNRAKRRLRAVAMQSLCALEARGHYDGGWDYVIIGRFEKTISLPFAALKKDFIHALEKIHSENFRAPARKTHRTKAL